METIKLQDKLQEIKDEVAKKEGHKNWHSILFQFSRGMVGYIQKNRLENEAMIAFAAYCCERQRESDAKAATTAPLSGKGFIDFSKQMVDKSSILNNKLITDEL